MSSLSRNVPILYILKVTTALGFMYPIWYLFEQQFLSIAQIALIEMIIVTSQLVLEIPTGAVADLFGYKVSIIIGQLINALGLTFFLFAHNFTGFLVFALLTGLGDSLKSGADEAIEYDTFRAMGQEKNFAAIKNKFALVFQIALAFAFLSGGIIADHFGYQATIWLTIGTTLMSALLTWFMIEPPITRHLHTLNSYLQQWTQGIKEVTKNERVKTISEFYTLAGAISWPVAVSLMAMYLTQMSLSASTQGILLGITRILNVLLLTALIRKTNHHNNVSLIMSAYVVFFLIGYVPTALSMTPLIPLVVMIISLSTTARWNVIGPLVHHQLDSKNRATAMSTLSMLIGISHALVMGLAALSLTFIGGPKGLITLMGVIGMVGTLWLKSKYQHVQI